MLRIGQIAAAPAVAVALLGGGCGGQRPPSAKMATADVAIREAEESDAATHAPLDLRLAQEKLDRAQRAVADEEYERARRLAEQALVDAELAEAKAQSAKAREEAEEVKRTVEAVREEATRPARPPY